MTPLWVISLFVSLTEVVAGLALTKAQGDVQWALTLFVVAFPLLVAGAFFSVLWFRPYVFYPPTEFGENTDVNAFVGAMRPLVDAPAPTTIQPTIAATVAVAEDKVNAVVDLAALPQPAEGWFELYTSKKYDEAIAALRTAAPDEDPPPDAVALESMIGRILLDKSRADGIAHYEDLFRRFPHEVGPYTWLAYAYAAGDDTDAALGVLARATALGLDDEDVGNTRADVLTRANRFAEAQTLLESLQKEYPHSTRATLALAALHAKTGSVELREAALREAVRRNPDDDDTSFLLARLLQEGDRDAEALQILLRLVQNNAENATYAGYLGNAYLALDLNALAFEQYERADKLAEGHESWIQANIGNLLKNRGLHSAAIPALRRAIELDPDSAYAHDRLAIAIKSLEEERKKERDLLGSIVRRPALGA